MRNLDPEEFEYGDSLVRPIRFISSVKNRRLWLWRCGCGNEFKRTAIDIRVALSRGQAVSCGCLLSVVRGKNGAANITHGMSKTKIYDVHRQMIQRCYNKNHPDFRFWGARGIKVCGEWHDIHEFARWANGSGYKEGVTIERKNVNGDYRPSNCTWILNEKQAHNTRRCIRVSFNGETFHLSEWARRTGISVRTLLGRNRHGWPPHLMLTVKPTRGRNQSDGFKTLSN